MRNLIKPSIQCITYLLFLTIMVGCAHAIKVLPYPTTSTVFLDGNQIGKGVTTVILHDKRRNYELLVEGPPGYFSRVTYINYRTPPSIEVTPPKDNSYNETVQANDIVNKWIILPINKKYEGLEAWRKATSSITTAISDFQVLDQKSFYLKTAWKIAGKPNDPLRTRSRIIFAVDNPDPKELSFKIRIESERINRKGETVERISRTFQDFIDAYETTKARLKN